MNFRLTFLFLLLLFGAWCVVALSFFMFGDGGLWSFTVFYAKMIAYMTTLVFGCLGFKSLVQKLL